MMALCDFCKSLASKDFPSGSCHVCKGSCENIPEMIDAAFEKLKGKDVSSFSISTHIPKDWMIREEELWDSAVAKGESIKNAVNREISRRISKETKLVYAPHADCRLSFDFRSKRVDFEYLPLFIFGRYKKLASGISQSRWLCQSCRGKGCKKCSGKGKYYHSIEEEIGNVMKKHADAGDYTLHASGREDVDATNSAGRSFVMEIKNAKKRKLDLQAIRQEIRKGKKVDVISLKAVPKSFVELVTESHFDKEYTVTAGFSDEITKEDVRKIEELSGETLKQRTPKRVVHRRSDKIRIRKIFVVKVAEKKGKKLVVKVKAEAGTYIKEFFSGDEGRTNPSVSSETKKDAKVTSLDVSKIEDGFLDLFLSR